MAAIAPEDLAFRARALAQAHPLSALARRYVDVAVARERQSQAPAEAAQWAAAAIVAGYCLRRVEEDVAGLHLDTTPDPLPALDALEDVAVSIADDVRRGEPGQSLLDDVDVVAALDRIVASEVDRRLDPWRAELDADACAELEEYLTWWVVKGYALRVAESATGALA